MKNVAERSGLSLMTVSYVLNNKGDMFRPETRERVLAAARELNYRPNASARATRSGRFGAIALLQSSEPFRSDLPGALLAGIQSATVKHDLHVILAGLPDEKLTDENFVPRILRQLSVDGLVVNYNAGIPQRLAELIQEFQVPAVWINSKQPMDCFRPDDVQGGRIATRKLLELGHRAIAYVDYAFGSEDTVVHYSTVDRQEAYEAEMRAAGLTPRVIRPVHKLDDEQRLHESLCWLRAADRPTAVVAYNDNTARPILYAAAVAGISVPRDLSVAGFFEQAKSGIGIDFSGIILPEREMGVQAVEALVQKLGDPKRQSPELALPVQWYAGGTTSALSD